MIGAVSIVPVHTSCRQARASEVRARQPQFLARPLRVEVLVLDLRPAVPCTSGVSVEPVARMISLHQLEHRHRHARCRGYRPAPRRGPR